ncbi:MAG: DUF1549 domain-containing protein [Candidatus Solibacter usitatus]|nr:DUF1549 domain-containing protein [Candidatus Solibacter usitatus]
MRPSAVLRRLSVFCLLSSALAQAQTAAGLDFFEQRIRPLLAGKCYPCHSAKTASSGGLRLDTGEAMRKGGNHGPAVVPERVDASLILRAVSYQDATLRMPPTSPLTEPEISDLTRWIEMGAPDPRTEAPAPSVGPARDFWAFQPFRAHPRPPVRDKKWPSTWVDAFLLAKLEARKLRPAPAADKRSLIRRVTFDLIGLPPTPAEVEAFLADHSPQAFEKVGMPGRS